jgi:hypothetical protein
LHAAIRDVQEPFHQQYPIYNRYDDTEHDEASVRAEHDRLEKILGKPAKTNAEIKAFLKGYDTKPIICLLGIVQVRVLIKTGIQIVGTLTNYITITPTDTKIDNGSFKDHL